jgi:hypothetical protein
MSDTMMVLKWSAAMRAKQQAHQPSTKVIQPGPHDVLCDRSRLAFNHIGNRRFRITVETKVPSYAVATHKSDRSRIVRSIVSIIQGAGGRFLTKSKCGDWKEVSKVRSNEKVGHALRAAISAMNAGGERTIYDVIGAVDADAAISEDEQHGQHAPGESRKRKLCEQIYDSVGTSPNETSLTDAFSLDVPLPDFALSNDIVMPGTSSESNDTGAMLDHLYDPDMALDSDDVLSIEFDPLFDDVDENVAMVFDQQYSGQYSHLFEELDDVIDEQHGVSFSVYGWEMADVAPCSG